MSRVKLGIAVALLGAVMTVSAAAVAGGGGKTKAKLSGFQEVPAVLTGAKGKIKLTINKSTKTIDYTLTYEGIEGGTVSGAHIHIGQRLANGGISTFLCGGGTKPTPCPTPSGTVTGTIAATDVMPVQGVDDIDELIEAIKLGITYANVHSTPKHPGGEIRGQIRGGGDD